MDYAKYNLRCNRNISEKMMKKDFIYDMKPPQQIFQKWTDAKPSVISSSQIPEKHIRLIRQPPRLMTLPLENELGGSGDAPMFRTRRSLNFECNFCHEPIATLFSLSTHVKFHLKTYCRKCYWILEGNETLEQHNKNNHPFFLNTPITLN